ncbi:MAG: sialate O-acetylesterase, partial [Muribaculaceae bacterium]|nr:sialate O-acetylesterase [Muribaculaceae bacterium]
GFALGDIPFYYVQIAPHDGYGDLSDNVARLRLAQSHLTKQLPNCGMVVTLDIGNKYCIHPTDKKTVGKRLAYWALAKDYGKNGYAYSGPIFDHMEWDGKRALLYFSNTGGGVSPLEQALDGFEAAGEDGVFHPARAIVECETGTLSVYCDEVGEIKAVRYAHSSCPTASLFDNFQLPASPFSTSGTLD